MTDRPSLSTALRGAPLSRRSLLRTLAAAGLILPGCLIGCKQQVKGSSGSTFAFDTYCTFTVYGDDSALATLSQECARYNRLFDLYNDASDIARINAAQGQAVEVHPDTADLIARALEYCERADGLFDITIGAVSTLWDFDAGVRPTDEEIAAALPHVGWRGVHVDEQASTVQLDDPQAKLDMGGIAKGYAADRLIEVLETQTDAAAAMVSLGGNVALMGEKPDGSTWDIGVRDPNDPSGDSIVGTAHLDSPLSLVTSGLYERTFELDGTTYWHILDPRTGMPVQTDVVSDTVACPSSTAADALSTTLFVAGSSRGMQIVDGLDDAAAYFLLEDGSSAASSRWQDATSFSD